MKLQNLFNFTGHIKSVNFRGHGCYFKHGRGIATDGCAAWVVATAVHIAAAAAAVVVGVGGCGGGGSGVGVGVVAAADPQWVSFQFGRQRWRLQWSHLTLLIVA